MSNQPILRSRQAAAGNNVPASPQRASLSERMAEAQAISRATEMLPKAYRGNPGAVLLAMDWAEKHGRDLITTIQHVTFINGRPNVSAELREEFATEAGYITETEEATSERATVAVYRNDGTFKGRYTAEIGKIPASVKNKDTWRDYQLQMLYATALRNACRLYAKGMPVLEADVVDDDPIDTLRPQEPREDPTPAAPTAPEAVIEAEVVEQPEPEQLASEPQAAQDEPEGDGAATTKDDLKEALRGRRQVEAIRYAQGIAEGDVFPQNLDQIAEHPELAARVLAWLQGGDQ